MRRTRLWYVTTGIDTQRNAPAEMPRVEEFRVAPSVGCGQAGKGTAEIKIKVRFVKLCATGGESPLSLGEEPLEFEAKAENGKV